MKYRFLARVSRLGIFLFLLLNVWPTLTGNVIQKNAPSSWQEAKEAFDRFARKPSCSMAREFYSTISETTRINDDETDLLDYVFGQRLDIIYRGNYPIIAIEMLQGNIYAARSAIRLLDFIDQGWKKPRLLTGPVGQYVGETLGELIRVNPELFLRSCYEEGKTPFFNKHGYPVGYIIYPMNKENSRAYYELETRRQALRSVEAVELRSIRDECVEAIDREIEKYGSDNSQIIGQRWGGGGDLRATIMRALMEMRSRPSPENMKRLLELFPAGPKETPAELILALKPLMDPFLLVLREARCGNEYAIEILFRNLVQCISGDAVLTYGELSNLIITKPGLFVEKLAKYAKLLDSVKSVIIEGDREISLNYFEETCVFISFNDYTEYTNELDCINTILRRRIEALEALNMPEHKDIISRCIQLIKGKLIKEREDH